MKSLKEAIDIVKALRSSGNVDKRYKVTRPSKIKMELPGLVKVAKFATSSSGVVSLEVAFVELLSQSKAEKAFREVEKYLKGGNSYVTGGFMGSYILESDKNKWMGGLSISSILITIKDALDRKPSLEAFNVANGFKIEL